MCIRDSILGVISDARYPKGGVKDPEAGLKLLREIRKRNPYLPLVVESSESSNREKTEREGFRFVDKKMCIRDSSTGTIFFMGTYQGK